VSKEFVEAVKQLVTDEELRADFLENPRKSLADLGVPNQMVERLVPALMAAIAAGGVILQDIEPLYDQVGWR
jgi:hypothetical protein